MSNVPEGAERSEDGQWWWDGSNWQPVDGAAAAGGEAGAGAGAGGEVDYQNVLSQLGVSSFDELRASNNAEPVEEDTDVASGTTDVVAFNDAAGGDNGEGVA